MDKKEALENLDLILLCLDEIVDGGYAIFLLYVQCLAISSLFQEIIVHRTPKPVKLVNSQIYLFLKIVQHYPRD